MCREDDAPASARRWRAPPRRTPCDAQRQRLAAHDARHVHPRERGDRQHDQVELAAEQRDQQDRDQQVRDRVHHVDEAHHRRCPRARR